MTIPNETEQHLEHDFVKSSGAGEQNSVTIINEIDKDPRVNPAFADDNVGPAEKNDSPTNSEHNLECSDKDSFGQIKCVMEDILAHLDMDSKMEESHERKETEGEGSWNIIKSCIQTPKLYLVCTSLSPYLLSRVASAAIHYFLYP